MKKILIILGFIFVLSRLSEASGIFIKINAGYFNPSDQAFKDIYGGRMTFGGEINIGILKNLDLWASGNYFSKKGQLTFSKEETKLTIIPIGIGTRYKILDGNIKPYIALGLNYYQFKESNPIGDVSKGGLGYIGKVGSFFKITRGLLVDLFLDYSYCKMKPTEFEINIGGLEAGIGIGYKF